MISQLLLKLAASATVVAAARFSLALILPDFDILSENAVLVYRISGYIIIGSLAGSAVASIWLDRSD